MLQPAPQPHGSVLWGPQGVPSPMGTIWEFLGMEEVEGIHPCIPLGPTSTGSALLGMLSTGESCSVLGKEIWKRVQGEKEAGNPK